MLYYFVLYKPFGVISQFSKLGEGPTLADTYDYPPDVYPVGRLDQDSEGLLLLTNDTELNHRLLHPGFQHVREYWVQVEGDISPQALDQLNSGVQISLDSKPYLTLGCRAEKFISPPAVPPRLPPVRFRKNIPDSWFRLILREGKNRQVRRMAAAVGFPVLRLIRYRIQQLSLGDMHPGEVRSWRKADIRHALFND